jgi:hypothetical protein
MVRPDATLCVVLTETRQSLRAPQLKDFARYLYYAQFVRSLSCAQEEVLPRHTFDILMARTTPTFPRLQRLQFFVPFESPHRSQYHHFLHPSLRELVLHDNGRPDTTMDAFLIAVKQRCTKLRTLQVVPYRFRRRDFEVDAALGQCLISLASITILSISVTFRGVGRALLLLASHLERLVHLTLFVFDSRQTDEVYFPPNPVSLPNLTGLSFIVPFPDFILVSFIPPPKLEVLHIRSEIAMNEEVWSATSESIAEFAKGLAHLREVLVFDYHPLDDEVVPFVPEVSTTGLGSLFKLPLRSVCITTTLYIPPTPALLQSVLDAWKDQLGLFVLSPIALLLNDPVPPATLQDVIRFAFKCPKLVRVGMLFNAEEPALAPTQAAEGKADGDEFGDVPAAPHVRELMAGAAWISDVDYVVRLLKHGFPCLERIDWADGETYLAMPEDRARKWEMVEKKLGLAP